MQKLRLTPGQTLGMLAIVALAACTAQESPTSGYEGDTDADARATVAPNGTNAAAARRITVIPKGTAHPYWKSVHAGAAEAAREFGVEITWIGPENEDDRRQQIDLVNSVAASGVNGIVLAPLDDSALVQPVEGAVAKGIPVVVIDSALKSDKQISFVATDNREGGRQGAHLLGKAMGGQGKAIMMRYQAGSASTTEREEGFMEVMASDYSGIELISTNQYAGATRNAAMDTGVNLLTRFGGEVQGIFCPNESSAAGMLLALTNKGKAGAIKFVGFDASEILIDGMRAGNVHGLVAQNPYGMGYLGVKAVVDHLEGRPVEKQVNTELVVVTPENLETEAIQKMIAPELAGL
jgi:ribose transport system substrate-binding protein